MKRLLSASLVLATAACGTGSDPDSEPLPQNGDVVPGQWIVTLDAAALPAGFVAGDEIQVATIADELGTVALFERGHLYAKALQGFSVVADDEQIEVLRNDARVRSIEPDRFVVLKQPDDVGAEGKPGSGQPSQSTPWGITRVGGPADGTGRTAWVIDSGIDLDHPDLNVDVGRSRTFLGGNSTPDDQNGHGTHVAGTIGAKNDAIGVVGVAANATLVSVRVLDRRGSGTYSGVIAGVDYVASAAASGDVANMSLGGPVSSALDDAVLNASSGGVKFALAAGNDSDDATNHSPARVNGPNIYTISATDSADKFASFSNYGSPVDYAEPGVSIRSTWKGGSYNTISGTSMAAPHAAGILLLGNIANGGTAIGDPDGNADTIGVR